MAGLGDDSSVSDMGSLDGSLGDFLDLDNDGPNQGFEVEVDEDGEFRLSPLLWGDSGGGGGAGAGGLGQGQGAAAEDSAAAAVLAGISQSRGWDKKKKKTKKVPPPPRYVEPQGRRPKSYASERWSCPPLFRPVRIPTDPCRNASDGVSLDELLAGEYTDALVATYLVDVEFLLKAAIRLCTVPFLLIQGIKEEKDKFKKMKEMLAQRAPQAVLYLPKTIHIGIQHSKIILLKYKTGVRVVIMTCNMQPDDWGGRCQAAWASARDHRRGRGSAARAWMIMSSCGPSARRVPTTLVFIPNFAGRSYLSRCSNTRVAGNGTRSSGTARLVDALPTSRCDLSLSKEVMADYFEHMGGPAAEWGRSLAAYDFSSANVTLIPSVPGRHFGKNLHKYGHMRVRAVLAKEEVYVRPGSHKVAFQVSSIMNLSRRPYKWLGEMTESFMAEKTTSNNGKDAKKAIPEVDVGYAEEQERKRKKKEEEEMNKRGNQPKKPLGQRKDPWGEKGILEKRRERAARREAIHRRNVLGLLPEKTPKPPKRLGKKAMKRKRREEREAAEAAAKIKWIGKERERNWFYKFLRVVWPTEEAIRTSNLGWESGAGMPCLTTSLFEGGYRKCELNYQLNRVMEEMKPLLCTWTGAKGMNRGDAMPHLNTYYRYRELQRKDGECSESLRKCFKDGLAYFLLGSHSMHRIAWGYLEHRNPPQRPRKRRVRMKPIYPPKPETTLPYKEEEAQLDIKSFDMGVMFLPSKLPPKRPLPMDYDSDDSDDVAAASVTASTAAPGPGDASAAAAAATVPPPFSCDPNGVLFREKPLSYRCPELAPAPRLKALPLGLLPIPHQLPAPPYEFTKTFGYRVVDKPWVWSRSIDKPDIFGKHIRLQKEKR
ncbi:unnamed protein product [Scytosiphon promiscuus]